MPAPVGIVADDSSNPVAEEIRNRLGSELLMAHIPWVRISQAQDLGNSPGGAPWALVFLVTSESSIAIDIALPARDAAGTSARRLIPVGAASALTPTELALRTVEVLRAHIAAGPLIRFGAPQTTAPKPPNVMGAQRQFQLNVGASAMRGTNGLAWGAGPAAAVTFIAVKNWGARLAFASSLLGGEAQGADVAADVSQLGLTTDLLWFARDQSSLARPYLLLGAGGFRVEARGQPDERLIAKSASKWAVAGVAGVGISVALGTGSLFLIAEAKILLLAPAVNVEVLGPVAGVAGRPSALCVGALAWTL